MTSVHCWPTVRSLADECGVTENTIFNWLKAEKMPPPAFKILKGKHVWDPQEIALWLAAGKPTMAELDAMEDPGE